MKTIIALALLLALNISVNAQTANPKYDKALADSLGGDEYGMKAYVLVLLKTGSNKTTDKVIIDSLFKGHMANINRLVDAGLLTVAGPLQKNEKSYRGIFILNVKTLDEANKLLVTDPAVREKLLEPELYIWYGSAALPVYLKSHELVEKKKF